MLLEFLNFDIDIDINTRVHMVTMSATCAVQCEGGSVSDCDCNCWRPPLLMSSNEVKWSGAAGPHLATRHAHVRPS